MANHLGKIAIGALIFVLGLLTAAVFYMALEFRSTAKALVFISERTNVAVECAKMSHEDDVMVRTGMVLLSRSVNNADSTVAEFQRLAKRYKRR